MAKEKSARLSVMALGLGAGIWWGLSMIAAGWMSMFNWGNAFVEMFSSLYIGYKATFIGAIIGGIWGFIDGFIAGVVLAAFYNLFRK